MNLREIRKLIEERIKELENNFHNPNIKWEPHHQEELERLKNMLEESYQAYN